MQWTDFMGNQYRLCYRFLSVRSMRFDGEYWAESKPIRGVVVKMTTWFKDEWFVAPEDLLAPKRKPLDKHCFIKGGSE